MTGQGGRTGGNRGYSRLFLVLLALAVLAAIAGLVWSYRLAGRLTHAEAQLLQAQQQNQKLASALNETNAHLKINSQTLGSSQKQLERRARDLLRRRQEAASQQPAQQNAGSASGEAAGAQIGPGDAKADQSNVQTESNAAEAQMQSIEGDLGLPSGLIATNQQELDILKKKGGRNYYQFTLKKGKKQTISGVTLELKKSDEKGSRYTVVVYTNEIKIEKKNRRLNEPVQFYVGKDNQLCELVVNSIEKNEVTGYLATPVNAQVPASTSGS